MQYGIGNKQLAKGNRPRQPNIKYYLYNTKYYRFHHLSTAGSRLLFQKK